MRVLASACVALALSSAAAAQDEPGNDGKFRDVVFDAHASLGWYDATGVGIRVDLPIAPTGILDTAEDDLRVSVGAELLWFYHSSYSGAGTFPTVALQWTFYLTPQWSIFPELGAAFLFAPRRERFWRTFAAPLLGFGARYHFSARNAFLIRVDWPIGLQAGVTF
jgi:hypothetical protein